MNVRDRRGRVQRLAAVVAEERGLLEQARVTTDWEVLAERESSLRERVVDLLSEPLAPDEVAAVRIALQELLTINREAIETIEARKADVVASLQHKALVQRAAKAYGNAAVGA